MRNKVNYVDSFLHFSIFFCKLRKNIYIFRLIIFFLSIFHTLSITFVSRQKCWCVLQDLVTMQDGFLSNQTFATRYNSHKKERQYRFFPFYWERILFSLTSNKNKEYCVLQLTIKFLKQPNGRLLL